LSEWTPALIVPESVQLERVLLHKAWIAYCSGQTVHFNETPIEPAQAELLLREAKLIE